MLTRILAVYSTVLTTVLAALHASTTCDDTRVRAQPEGKPPPGRACPARAGNRPLAEQIVVLNQGHVEQEGTGGKRVEDGPPHH